MLSSQVLAAYVSYTAALGIERLYLNGAANINATGIDGQADHLGGSSGNNALEGKGGADVLFGLNGIDQLYGGSGLDQLYCGEGADYQSGGGAKDVFFGGARFDTMACGAGDDEFFAQAGDGGDVIVEYAGEGNDRIFSEISYALAANPQIETLSAAANSATANIISLAQDRPITSLTTTARTFSTGRRQRHSLWTWQRGLLHVFLRAKQQQC